MDFAESLARRVASTLDLASVGMTVEDCVQNGLIGLMPAARRFDQANHDSTVSTVKTHFRSFAYLRIRGAVVDEWRKLHVRTRGEAGGELLPEMHAMPANDPDEWLDVASAVARLDERETSVVLALVAGMTHAEMAIALDISESRVGSIVRDIRERLLEEAGTDT